MSKSLKAKAGFHDHARKVLFRTQWAKPLLKFISEKLDRRLVYLGLPGVKALDILEWKEYLRVIIAFQLDGDEDELEELQTILDDLEASEQVENYKLYIGYLEEVIISGIDTGHNKFALSNFVTVYNLDFCNALTNPVKTFDKKGKVLKYFKIKAIEKLLEFERQRCETDGSYFLMFLTVNTFFWADELGAIQSEVLDNYVETNLVNCQGEPRDIRMLKAYAYHHLTLIFKQFDFNVEFLPTIYYKGYGKYEDKEGELQDHWLLTFTMLGTPIEAKYPQVEYNQDYKSLLERKFVHLSDKNISLYLDENIYEDDFDPSISNIIENCFSNQSLW